MYRVIIIIIIIVVVIIIIIGYIAFSMGALKNVFSPKELALMNIQVSTHTHTHTKDKSIHKTEKERAGTQLLYDHLIYITSALRHYN